MKLVLYELYKQLSGRILWLVMALLILLNVIFCFRETSDDYDPQELKALKAAEKIVKANPEEVYLSYRTMLALDEAYNEAYDEWLELYMMSLGDPTAEDCRPNPNRLKFPPLTTRDGTIFACSTFITTMC